jgi:Asp-tRNA(Asn)/Glu-tRNA(Gln) amidotransferase A subunit family amidase
MLDEFAQLDATAQADLIRHGEIAPIALVAAAIARIERLNPQLNAVITPLFDQGRTQALSPHLPARVFSWRAIAPQRFPLPNRRRSLL